MIPTVGHDHFLSKIMTIPQTLDWAMILEVGKDPPPPTLDHNPLGWSAP